MSITIVIPYHNREKFLRRTLDSVAAQTHRPLEVVLVDNGSTDGSAEICHAFKAQHEAPDFCIRLLEEPEPGAARARNRGLADVHSDYVYFFDSDDEMSPAFIADAAHELAAHPKLDVLALRTVMCFPNGQKKTRAAYFNSSVTDQILTGMLATQSVVLRTDFLRAVGAWQPLAVCWNDWELGIRLLLHRPRLRWMKGRAYHLIHQHPESLTGSALSPKLPHILTTLRLAEAAVQNHPSALKALRARHIIVAATLVREGNAAWRNVLNDALSKTNAAERFMLRRLFFPYCRFISKGAWLIFRTLAAPHEAEQRD